MKKYTFIFRRNLKNIIYQFILYTYINIYAQLSITYYMNPPTSSFCATCVLSKAQSKFSYLNITIIGTIGIRSH